MPSKRPAIFSVPTGQVGRWMALIIAIIAGIAATLKNDFRTLFFRGKEVIVPPISNTATPAIPAIPAICGGVEGGLALCW